MVPEGLFFALRVSFARKLMRDRASCARHLPSGRTFALGQYLCLQLPQQRIALLFGTSDFYDVCIYDYMHFHFLLSTRRYDYDAAIDRNFARGKFIDGKATNFQNATLTEAELRKELDIPLWLRGLAMAAPLVGIVAFVIFLAHIISFVCSCKAERASEAEAANQRNSRGEEDLHMPGARVMVRGQQKPGTVVMVDPRDTDGIPYKIRFDADETVQEGFVKRAQAAVLKALQTLSGAPNSSTVEEKEDWFSAEDVTGIQEDINPWVADVHEDLALLVVMMPAVFIVMAMKGGIRVIQVMTASTLREGQLWEEYELPLMGTYATDLELSAACQYITVFAFAMLCTRFFNLSQLEKIIVNRENHFYMKVNELLTTTQGAGGVDDEYRRKLLAPDGKSKDDIVRELRRKSEQHHVTLSAAGLLGVWAYVFVGLLRSLFGIFVAVELEGSGGRADAVRSLQGFVLDKIQPVLFFAMGLCIVNMIVVLRIPDLKSPQAFGINANIKFIACRGLLIVSDGQANFLTALTKKTSLTIYQAKLTHVSLLMVECFAVVLFNSIMWKQTVRMRSIEAKEQVAQVLQQVVQIEVPSFRTLATSEVFLGSIVAPLVVLFGVLVAATSTGGGPVDKVPDQPFPIVAFDMLFQLAGPLLALTVLFLRKSFSHSDPCATCLTESHDSVFAWLPRGWVATTLLVWILIATLRWVFFMLTHPFHDDFSDHIFLVMSVVAMLQMELSLAHIGWRKNRSELSSIAVLVATWVLLILIYWDAWNTAMFYHTPQAVWTAYFVGLGCFECVAIWWLQLLVSSANDRSKVDSGHPGVVSRRIPLLSAAAASSQA
eukprot:TRINITY_DN25167_c0_g1_i1.p1 TRINITY_DN25167_c0_g1~~TRINITY_DN25167_c0_g1_i1.p1  ORF type:complete len:831 (+),score=183.70 TRINITY_DN25167_c0_g1_i1:1735-4227(+)